MANENAVQDAVAPVPKLFVGQVPMECTEEQLGAVMQRYGESRVSIIKGRLKIPQTCFAMATFTKWASAEAALEALHGSTEFGSKPLVVRFADPPKGEDSKGIVPKKLFVGQIPKECSESQVRSWFEPYGSIVSLVVKRNAVAANISFVLFSTWAAAEQAVAALHGTKPVDSAANALVVKFADGKGKPATDGMGVGVKRGSDADSAGLSKRANLGMGPMAGMRGAGMGMPGGMVAGGYGGPHAYAMMGGMHGRMGMWSADGSPAADGMQGAEMNQMGGIHRSMGMGMGAGMGRMGAGMNPEMAMSMGGMHAGAMGGMTGMGMGMSGMPMGGIPGMYEDDMGMRGGYGGQDAVAGGMGIGLGMPMGGAYGAMAMGGENGMAAAHLNGGGGAAPGAAAASARTCPWKLFVGQLPFAATEEDLVVLFGSFGDIVECKVLRKAGNMESKGCGFVTFSAAEHAAMAISALNQQAAIPGHARRLIVHYAK